MADIILGIESSCDDTSAAVIKDGYLLSNVLASQDVHKAYGGVIPELASRAHQVNIVPVVSEAISRAGIDAYEITAIAFTRGPGLLGSLLVGTSFAKGLAMSIGKPLVEVNHLQGHVLANFIKQYGAGNRQPEFPYLCLLVSGGNSQIVKVNSPLEYEILGQTIDDAVGEAFDKCSKMMGLGYPGGPVVDRLAKEGDPDKFKFSKPHVPGLDYSFSGLKTSAAQYVEKEHGEGAWFAKAQKDKAERKKLGNFCAAFNEAVAETLCIKTKRAIKRNRDVRALVVAGGVAANSMLRAKMGKLGEKYGLPLHCPRPALCTDNGIMIAQAGYLLAREGFSHGLEMETIPRGRKMPDDMKAPQNILV